MFVTGTHGVMVLSYNASHHFQESFKRSMLLGRLAPFLIPNTSLFLDPIITSWENENLIIHKDFSHFDDGPASLFLYEHYS